MRRRTLCYWCGCSSGKDKARLTPKFEKLVRKHVPGSESYRTADFRTPDGLCHSCRGKLTWSGHYVHNSVFLQKVLEINDNSLGRKDMLSIARSINIHVFVSDP